LNGFRELWRRRFVKGGNGGKEEWLGFCYLKSENIEVGGRELKRQSSVKEQLTGFKRDCGRQERCLPFRRYASL